MGEKGTLELKGWPPSEPLPLPPSTGRGLGRIDAGTDAHSPYPLTQLFHPLAPTKSRRKVLLEDKPTMRISLPKKNEILKMNFS